MQYKKISQNGFTLIELAVVIAILGILLVPLAATMQKARVAATAGGNKAALESAREALLAYAVQHKGCLPHAADFEGGIENTDEDGDGNVYNDTGSVRTAVEPATGNVGQRAGDVPWADIQLGNIGRDANNYRIQYYVGNVYTSPTQTRASNNNTATRDDCAARIRSSTEVWDSTARYAQGDTVVHDGLYYVATAATTAGTVPVIPAVAPWALFGSSGILPTWNTATTYNLNDYASLNGRTYRSLIAANLNNQPPSPAAWQEVGVAGQATPYPAWQAGTYLRGEITARNGRTYRVTLASTLNTPPAVGWQEISTTNTRMLETRVGTDITNTPGSTVTSSRNVFVLIAPGSDRSSATLGSRLAMRDANHQTCTPACTPWVDLNEPNVDDSTFSITPDTVASPTSADTILSVSFADYQAALAKHNLNTQGLAW